MRSPALLLTLLCLCASSARAQSALERRVSLHAQDLALRDALDSVAARARIRLSYSAEAIPAERRVSIKRDAVTVGEVLRVLLGELPVTPVAIASDHVVLAPRTRATGEDLRPATLLEVVDVHDDAAATGAAPSSIARDVLSGRDMERRNESTLSQLLSGVVPGVWLWEQAPSSMIANYGSVRGASSFGVSTPKVYVDGIEVANPLFLTHLTPELVDRVEVVRGPHGAALYGADAISGVINIVSRHGMPAGSSPATIRSDFGWARSAFGAAAPTQRHAVDLRAGSALRAGGLSIRGATSGNYIPNAYSRELQALGDLRVITSATSVAVTGRIHGKRAGVPSNPLLTDAWSPPDHARAEPQELGVYTLGATVTRAASDDLTYTFTAGMDGYRLSNILASTSPAPSSADSALHSAAGGADRLTLRMSSARQHSLSRSVHGALTVGAEQALLRDRSLFEDAPAILGDTGALARVSRVEWSTNSGVLAQADLAIHDAVFLTAGSRVERITLERRRPIVAWLPRMGISARRTFHAVTATARASYGRGIRSPSAGARSPYSWNAFRRGEALGPESQTGIESGLDLSVGQLAELHVTRFDQVASGLLATGVGDSQDAATASGASPVGSTLHLGIITNRGWEARGLLRLDRLSLGGAASLTDSRVRRAGDFAGELRPGDRMLGVPRHTGSLTAEWFERAWSTAWTVSRASDWINYDRLRIAHALDAGDISLDQLTGVKLREFWLNYPGTTRLRGTFAVRLPRDMSMVLTAENLTNDQLGEPDNITIVPGRAITLGLRARF